MRCVFVGTPGFLGRIDSQTRCAFWAEEPVDHGFDPALLIEVDLACTPGAAVAGLIEWTAVQVDDCFSGPHGTVAGTTLGPSTWQATAGRRWRRAAPARSSPDRWRIMSRRAGC